MARRKTKKAEIMNFKIKGSLSIYEVNHIQEKLMELLQENDKIELDLNSINECDASGLQILYSARKTADELEKEIIFSRVSKTLKDTAVRIGIDPEIIFN